MIDLYCNFSNSVCILPYICLCSGNRETQQVLQLKMNFKNLMVSWNVPPQLSDGLKEYVVEYKQAGSPLGQAFDWVKLNKSQTTAFFRGLFRLIDFQFCKRWQLLLALS